jgi:hypothetical protein
MGFLVAGLAGAAVLGKARTASAAAIGISGAR